MHAVCRTLTLVLLATAAALVRTPWSFLPPHRWHSHVTCLLLTMSPAGRTHP